MDEPSPSNEDTTKFPPSGPARLQLACQALIQARDALLVGFGKENGGGEVGEEVRELLVRLEKELEVWRVRGGGALEDARQAASRVWFRPR